MNGEAQVMSIAAMLFGFFMGHQWQRGKMDQLKKTEKELRAKIAGHESGMSRITERLNKVGGRR